MPPLRICFSYCVCERSQDWWELLALNIGFNKETWVRNFVVYNMLCQRLSTFLSYDDTFRRVIRPFADARGFLSSLNRGDVA